MGTFHLPKTLRNFHGNVHRVKNVFHLTKVPLVFALITKIQDGGTDIAVNSIELVIPRKNPVNQTCISIGKVSSGKTGLPFQFFSYSREFSSGTPDKSMFHLHLNKNFRNFLVNEKHPICFFW